jgi:hypothetical protein
MTISASGAVSLPTSSLTITSGATLNGGVVVNELGADVDFRVEGDTDANLLFVDASTDRVGVGLSDPSTKFTVGHASHGIGMAYMGASAFPSIAGLFTDSTNGQTGFGTLHVKARTDFGGFYSINFWTASTSNTPVERARITSGGLFQVTATGSNNTFTNGGQISLKSSDSAPYISWHESTGARIGYLQMSAGGNTNLWVEANQPLVFATNNAERARITSGGVLQINTTASIAANYKFITKTGTDMNLCISEQSNQLSIEAANDAVTANVPLRIYANPLYVLSGETIVGGTTDNGAYNLQCNGTGVWGAGAYVNGSDARIKEDIAPIASGLDVVEKLNPITYRYKESWSKDQSTQTGFIAQELLTALDGQVYVDGVVQHGGAEDYYSVAYQNIIPILTKAIQELKAELDVTKAEVAALKGTN